jgi:hypothetical protein
MNHFNFLQDFRKLYDKAVALYAKGQRGPDTFFTREEIGWLAANGMTAQHLYDYAEDHNNYGGEPGLEHAQAIECVRRDYFLNVQGGKPSATRIDMEKLPGKTETARGIAWLPRLIPKAKAKLRGELPDSLMFCCGGDRKFFQEHNILPGEFLSLIWRHQNDDAAIVEWVVRRSSK